MICADAFKTSDYHAMLLGLVPELRDNVRIEHYEAGHMMYLHKPSLTKLAADLRGFVKDSA